MRERVLHLWQQIAFQELRHLVGLGVHDAIEAEVQVGLVELEQLLEQADQFLEFGGIGGVRHGVLYWMTVRSRLGNGGAAVGQHGVIVAGEQADEIGMDEDFSRPILFSLSMPRAASCLR